MLILFSLFLFYCSLILPISFSFSYTHSHFYSLTLSFSLYLPNLSKTFSNSLPQLPDWLKIRGTLKSWTKLWCILKPGILLLYKSPKVKSSHWVGTVLLNSCQVIERPSKKDGFCFKLFHLSDQSIWGRGPEKESIGAVVQPLPTSYLIFRAPSQAAGKCWMDALGMVLKMGSNLFFVIQKSFFILELSLRCSALLVRSISSGVPDASIDTHATTTHETQWSEADYEKHFNEHGEFFFSFIFPET